MAFKHRSQIDCIRSFYQTIAFVTTRTGKIVKTAMETSSAVANIMKELESTYEWMLLNYTVHYTMHPVCCSIYLYDY